MPPARRRGRARIQRASRWEVRLEDKFHGLELVHIARRYNEAADELAKIASTRGTVPPDALSRDLHEPSVDLGSGAGVDATPAQPTDNVDTLLTSQR